MLDGQGGADSLFGRAGNDTYYVDNAHDRVYETETSATTDVTDLGGANTVASSISWTLSSFIEKLTLTGAGNVAGTGNALDNNITGNDRANTLRGQAGEDVSRGGGGSATLYGGRAGYADRAVRPPTASFSIAL